MTTPRKPKAPVDYSKARLYVIRSPHTDKVYIGATTQQLSKRLYYHKDHFKRWLNGKCHYVSSYEVVQAGNAYIELLKECPCENREQLAKYEGEAIRDTANCCNKRVEGRTRKEYRDDNKQAIQQRIKNYNETHKEKLQQQHKQYYEVNKEAIQQQERKYREDNKEAIQQRKKEYHKANKDRINQQRRARYQQKKQQINNELTPPPRPQNIIISLDQTTETAIK